MAAAAWKTSTADLGRGPVAKRAFVPRVGAKPVPVFLIEDNKLLRSGLEAMLGSQGLKVMATAKTGAAALPHVKRLKPRLVLVDSALSDRDELDFIAAVRKASPETRLIVMHLLPTHEDVAELVRAGVSGFIMKDASVTEFVATLRAVADGAQVLPPPVAATLFSDVAAKTIAGGKRRVTAAMRMTTREREVTSLIAKGLANREISARLGIAQHTVKSHVHNILEKLALRTRLEVAAFAHGNGRVARGGKTASRGKRR